MAEVEQDCLNLRAKEFFVNYREFVWTGLVAVGLALVAPAAHANLVVNGGFETVTAGAPKGQLRVNVTLAGWTCTVCGTGGRNFTFLDASGQATSSTGGYAVYTGLAATSPNGGNFIQADAAPTYNAPIEQTIGGLTNGALYLLTFFQAAGQQTGFSGPTTEYWDVSLGASAVKSSTVMSTSDAKQYSAWAPISMFFQATGSTQVLRFLAQGTPDNQPPTAFLDGVSLVAVPEPSSMAVISLATLGLGAIGARRRRAQSAAA